MYTNPLTQEFLNLRQAMDQLFEEAFSGSPFRTIWSRAGLTNGVTTWALPLDVYATDNEVVILAAAPGMRPEDLDISFHQGTLVLSGKIADVAESEDAKGATWYLHELPRGTFRRVVTLPFEVNPDQAQATFEHGIVRIVLPKAEQAKPKKIAIRIGEEAKAVTAGSTTQA
jgi:HSP20 family protein